MPRPGREMQRRYIRCWSPHWRNCSWITIQKAQSAGGFTNFRRRHRNHLQIGPLLVARGRGDKELFSELLADIQEDGRGNVYRGCPPIGYDEDLQVYTEGRREETPSIQIPGFNTTRREWENSHAQSSQMQGSGRLLRGAPQGPPILSRAEDMGKSCSERPSWQDTKT